VVRRQEEKSGKGGPPAGSLAQTALPLAVTEAEYNADNQLTEWGTTGLYYDPNGNMTSDGVNSLTWNARNQLASMDASAYSFQYDGYGRRYGKTISGTTTNYLYDGANTVQEVSGSTVTANLLTGLGVDERFARTDSSGTANFLADALGSTLALTNSSGSSLAQYAYDPFGNTTVTSGSSTNSYEYTGRENDGTGLYFNRARYYNPSLQRFISEDPLGLTAGIAVYSYTDEDPIDLVDAFGLQSGTTYKLEYDNLNSVPLPPMEPFPQGNDSLSPYVAYPFDWYHYVPTHGNWCGPDWSGGWHPSLHKRKDGPAPPTDPLDELCKQHDAAYEPTAPDSGHRPADIRLRDQAQKLPGDPRYDTYRWWLIKGFNLRISSSVP
jgi:RHS repeat-associated protein